MKGNNEFGQPLSLSVVHSLLQCNVGLNECTQCPLWFWTPLHMAVPSNNTLFEGYRRCFWIQPMERGKLGWKIGWLGLRR